MAQNKLQLGVESIETVFFEGGESLQLAYSIFNRKFIELVYKYQDTILEGKIGDFSSGYDIPLLAYGKENQVGSFSFVIRQTGIPNHEQVKQIIQFFQELNMFFKKDNLLKTPDRINFILYIDSESHSAPGAQTYAKEIGAILNELLANNVRYYICGSFDNVGFATRLIFMFVKLFGMYSVKIHNKTEYTDLLSEIYSEDKGESIQ